MFLCFFFPFCVVGMYGWRMPSFSNISGMY
nr:MAG TPA: hypothetical protein [Caudoviricetes sp.]